MGVGENKDKKLLLFQLGPVQEFIAQAATPVDLWAGSYLLSSIMKAGLDQLNDKGVPREDVVFPNISDCSIEKALEQNIPTLPNRFLAKVPSNVDAEWVNQIGKAMKAKLLDLAKNGNSALDVGAHKQLEQFLSITWAIAPMSGDMKKDYESITTLLGMRRNIRDFSPWAEEKACERLPKDFLSGRESAIYGKRGAANALKVQLASTQKYSAEIQRAYADEKYYAVVCFDGDRIGKHLSGLASDDDHRDFSVALARFALGVKTVISEVEYDRGTDKPQIVKVGDKGILVYAGGDDVMAVVPARAAINVASALRRNFGKMVSGLTASVGVAIGHKKVPFQDLVYAARAAEHRAKVKYDRNAFSLTVLKRSGEKLGWGFKWENGEANDGRGNAIKLYDMVWNADKDANLSGRFPHKLAQILQPYDVQAKDAAAMINVVKADVAHVWGRSLSSGGATDKVTSAAMPPSVVGDYLNDTYGKSHPEDFLNLFLVETFIKRPKEDEK